MKYIKKLQFLLIILMFVSNVFACYPDCSDLDVITEDQWETIPEQERTSELFEKLDGRTVDSFIAMPHSEQRKFMSSVENARENTEIANQYYSDSNNVGHNSEVDDMYFQEEGNLQINPDSSNVYLNILYGLDEGSQINFIISPGMTFSNNDGLCYNSVCVLGDDMPEGTTQVSYDSIASKFIFDPDISIDIADGQIEYSEGEFVLQDGVTVEHTKFGKTLIFSDGTRILYDSNNNLVRIEGSVSGNMQTSLGTILNYVNEGVIQINSEKFMIGEKVEARLENWIYSNDEKLIDANNFFLTIKDGNVDSLTMGRDSVFTDLTGRIRVGKTGEARILFNVDGSWENVDVEDSEVRITRFNRDNPQYLSFQGDFVIDFNSGELSFAELKSSGSYVVDNNYGNKIIQKSENLIINFVPDAQIPENCKANNVYLGNMGSLASKGIMTIKTPSVHIDSLMSDTTIDYSPYGLLGSGIEDILIIDGSSNGVLANVKKKVSIGSIAEGYNLKESLFLDIDVIKRGSDIEILPNQEIFNSLNSIVGEKEFLFMDRNFVLKSKKGPDTFYINGDLRANYETFDSGIDIMSQYDTHVYVGELQGPEFLGLNIASKNLPLSSAFLHAYENEHRGTNEAGRALLAAFTIDRMLVELNFDKDSNEQQEEILKLRAAMVNLDELGLNPDGTQKVQDLRNQMLESTLDIFLETDEERDSRRDIDLAAEKAERVAEYIDDFFAEFQENYPDLVQEAAIQISEYHSLNQDAEQSKRYLREAILQDPDSEIGRESQIKLNRQIAIEHINMGRALRQSMFENDMNKALQPNAWLDGMDFIDSLDPLVFENDETFLEHVGSVFGNGFRGIQALAPMNNIKALDRDQKKEYLRQAYETTEQAYSLVEKLIYEGHVSSLEEAYRVIRVAAAPANIQVGSSNTQNIGLIGGLDLEGSTLNEKSAYYRAQSEDLEIIALANRLKLEGHLEGASMGVLTFLENEPSFQSGIALSDVSNNNEQQILDMARDYKRLDRYEASALVVEQLRNSENEEIRREANALYDEMTGKGVKGFTAQMLHPDSIETIATSLTNPFEMVLYAKGLGKVAQLATKTKLGAAVVNPLNKVMTLPGRMAGGGSSTGRLLAAGATQFVMEEVVFEEGLPYVISQALSFGNQAQASVIKNTLSSAVIALTGYDGVDALQKEVRHSLEGLQKKIELNKFKSADLEEHMKLVAKKSDGKIEILDDGVIRHTRKSGEVYEVKVEDGKIKGEYKGNQVDLDQAVLARGSRAMLEEGRLLSRKKPTLEEIADLNDIDSFDVRRDELYSQAEIMTTRKKQLEVMRGVLTSEQKIELEYLEHAAIDPLAIKKKQDLTDQIRQIEDENGLSDLKRELKKAKLKDRPDIERRIKDLEGRMQTEIQGYKAKVEELKSINKEIGTRVGYMNTNPLELETVIDDVLHTTHLGKAKSDGFKVDRSKALAEQSDDLIGQFEDLQEQVISRYRKGIDIEETEILESGRFSIDSRQEELLRVMSHQHNDLVYRALRDGSISEAIDRLNAGKGIKITEAQYVEMLHNNFVHNMQRAILSDGISVQTKSGRMITLGSGRNKAIAENGLEHIVASQVRALKSADLIGSDGISGVSMSGLNQLELFNAQLVHDFGKGSAIVNSGHMRHIHGLTDGDLAGDHAFSGVRYLDESADQLRIIYGDEGYERMRKLVAKHDIEENYQIRSPSNPEELNAQLYQMQLNIMSGVDNTAGVRTSYKYKTRNGADVSLDLSDKSVRTLEVPGNQEMLFRLIELRESADGNFIRHGSEVQAVSDIEEMIRSKMKQNIDATDFTPEQKRLLRAAVDHDINSQGTDYLKRNMVTGHLEPARVDVIDSREIPVYEYRYADNVGDISKIQSRRKGGTNGRDIVYDSTMGIFKADSGAVITRTSSGVEIKYVKDSSGMTWVVEEGLEPRKLLRDGESIEFKDFLKKDLKKKYKAGDEIIGFETHASNSNIGKYGDGYLEPVVVSKVEFKSDATTSTPYQKALAQEYEHDYHAHNKKLEKMADLDRLLMNVAKGGLDYQKIADTLRYHDPSIDVRGLRSKTGSDLTAAVKSRIDKLKIKLEQDYYRGTSFASPNLGRNDYLDVPSRAGDRMAYANALISPDTVAVQRRFVEVLDDRLDTLEESFPKAKVEGRIKDATSLEEKVIRTLEDQRGASSKPDLTRGDVLRISRNPSETEIWDVAGGRVIFEDFAQLEQAQETFMKAFDGQVIGGKPAKAIDQVADDGYRSVHYYVANENGEIVEIQMRTQRQNEWADWSHDDLYKGDLKGNKVAEDYGRAVSDYLYDLDTGKKGIIPNCPEIIARLNKCFKCKAPIC